MKYKSIPDIYREAMGNRDRGNGSEQVRLSYSLVSEDLDSDSLFYVWKIFLNAYNCHTV